MEPIDLIAKLAVEHWRVLRMYERAIAMVPLDHHAKHDAQLRYATSRLDTLLSEAGIRLKEYDGQPYSPNLPVIVLNGDDCAGEVDLQVQQTLEPTVLEQGSVRAMGKVVLASRGSA